MEAETAWATSQHLLQKLAAANSTPQDWARQMMGIHMLEQLMDQMPPSTYPAWLLPALCAAVARGLSPAILGMSGQKPRTGALFEPPRSGTTDAQMVLLTALAGVCELLGRLLEVLHVLM
jgi:hypothetical protein